MHIDQLIYYSEVFRTRSINTASLNLQIAQQSLSSSIRNLEKEFNAQFFIRSAKGVIPTRDGELFYQTAQAILNEINNFTASIRPDTLPATCTIGYFNADINSSGKLFAFLEQSYPDIFFDISAFAYQDLLTLSPNKWPNIIFTFFNKPLLNSFSLPEEYEMKILSSSTSFRIWLNNNSQFKNHKQLNSSHISSIKFAFLKSLYPNSDIIRAIYPTIPDENIYLAQTQDIFTKMLLKKNYSTTEIMINNQPICFPELQNNNQFILKPLSSSTHNNISLVLIYRKDFAQLYPTIADYLLSLYGY